MMTLPYLPSLSKAREFSGQGFSRSNGTDTLEITDRDKLSSRERVNPSGHELSDVNRYHLAVILPDREILLDHGTNGAIRFHRRE
jgi:hypothetical protein